MNATQRKFLVDKINTTVKARISALEKGKLEYPSISNFVFKAILSDTLEVQPPEVLLAELKRMALSSKEGRNWLNADSWYGYSSEIITKVKLSALIKVPTDYEEELKRVQEHNDAIMLEVSELRAQLDTTEMRVELASDKTLQKLINDVDDMGDLGLIDGKLKLLS